MGQCHQALTTHSPLFIMKNSPHALNCTHCTLQDLRRDDIERHLQTIKELIDLRHRNHKRRAEADVVNWRDANDKALLMRCLHH